MRWSVALCCAALSWLIPTVSSVEAAEAASNSVYAGTHRLGVNRITFDQRTGSVTFTKRDGGLYLSGRVEKGEYWLELSGKVEIEGPQVFHLTGVITGIPDMSWADEAPRVRRTEGRFTFKVRGGRKFWRMYMVDGNDCVCGEDCGNDFCYIDIEHLPIAK